MKRGLITEGFNQRRFANLDAHRSKEPSAVILEDWLRDNVLIQS